VIVPPVGVRVLVATRPVDFRRGADGLAAVVQTALRQDPFSGTIYVFRSKRADRVKLLVWDGSGLVLVWKRLEASGFKWPPISDGVMRLSVAQLAALLEGLDWSRVHVPRLGRPKVAQ
jgi:transposase